MFRTQIWIKFSIWIHEDRYVVLISKFRPDDELFIYEWEKYSLLSSDLWGGEPAASIITSYLTPELFTLYRDETLPAIVGNYKWIPDEEGVITVYKKFWRNELSEQDQTVSPFLVYCDLINSGISRNIETAQKLIND